jgi:hypothetical protein
MARQPTLSWKTFPQGLREWIGLFLTGMGAAIGAGIGGALAEPHLAVGAFAGGLMMGIPSWLAVRKYVLV